MDPIARFITAAKNNLRTVILPEGAEPVAQDGQAPALLVPEGAIVTQGGATGVAAIFEIVEGTRTARPVEPHHDSAEPLALEILSQQPLARQHDLRRVVVAVDEEQDVARRLRRRGIGASSRRSGS